MIRRRRAGRGRGTAHRAGPRRCCASGRVLPGAHACQLLARPGVGEVVAVLGHEAARVLARGRLPARTCGSSRTSATAEGMLSSICARPRRGGERAGADAVLLHPVDHPLVAPETVDRVVAALAAARASRSPATTAGAGTRAASRGRPGPRCARARPQRAPGRCWPAHPDWIVHVAGRRRLPGRHRHARRLRAPHRPAVLTWYPSGLCGRREARTGRP